MTGEEIVKLARGVCDDFQAKCRKFSGAVTTELMRSALAKEGISASARDVFIRGIPWEIDLIVPYPGEEPKYSILYEPRQVAVALEIKKTGSFGADALQKIQNTFNSLKKHKIECAYVTLEERQSYRHRATTENLGGFQCFTLAWHKITGGTLEETQDWNRLLSFLRNHISPTRS